MGRGSEQDRRRNGSHRVMSSATTKLLSSSARLRGDLHQTRSISFATIQPLGSLIGGGPK
jgi:hypothetical protein